MVSVVALLVALGGTGYAVTQLPGNSVGTPQLKNNAVSTAKVRNNAITGAKVKDGSLTARDFQAGTLLRGPAGATGPRGATGDQGPPGPAGATGGVAETVMWVKSKWPSVTTGPGVLSVENTSGFAANLFVVTFDRPVEDCAITIGSPYTGTYILTQSQAAASLTASQVNVGAMNGWFSLMAIC